MRSAAPLLLVLAACSGGGRAAAPKGQPGADSGLSGAGTIDAGPPCVEPAYPAGPYGTAVGTTLGDVSWSGVTAAGVSGTVALHDALAGCPGDPPILLVRIDAVWCGATRRRPTAAAMRSC